MALTIARGPSEPSPRSPGPRTGGRWSQIRGRRDEFWPLVTYFYLFPLWWVLGLAHLMLFIVAVPMLWQLMSVRKIKVPRGFALLAVFLAWMMLSVTMLWVRAPSTVPNSGPQPLLGFGFRAAWYISIAIATLYVLNASRDKLTARRVVRMLAYLFVVTVIGGYAGIYLSNVDFPSLLELFLPHSITSQTFFSSQLHPRLALQSDILGYVQPRITAPYAYPNTWGNAFGVLLPFFVLGWFGEGAGWRRYVGPVVLLASVVPVVNSLNRGLWLGLGLSFAWVVFREICGGRLRALVAALLVGAIGFIVLASTSLGTTIALRIANPQSDARRQDTASTVVSATAHTSPLLGFGMTRQMVGNFNSLAGGGTAKCYQCAAPPLGTQGFLWGLIFTTGFVGAALFAGFLLWHVAMNAVRAGPLALAVSTMLIGTLFYFFFYDSLDVPLLVTFIGLALADREYEAAADDPVRGP